jgi:cytochrome b involved in lipid metabolism
LLAVSLTAGVLLSRSECEGEAKNFKIFRASEVAEHTTEKTGIWVTYKDGVYDITSFIANHPGGRQWLM